MAYSHEQINSTLCYVGKKASTAELLQLDVLGIKNSTESKSREEMALAVK